ncbi:MAG TPA: GGDEF domain-containing protein [Xanthobacteraceae bacterium]|jgi:diguanylate cyclase (GGDEF)-like protein|nr:GGDEF domain-containing protein [Xanthobacteraceae bacterium]
MNLDVNTLFLVTIYVEAILGLLLLFAWVQNTAIYAVAWWGFADLLRAASVMLFGMYGSVSDLISIDLANAILFTAFAVTWTGARVFDHRKPNWILLFGGAALWLVLCRIPAVQGSWDLRMLFSSGIITAYTWATAYEFWRGRSEPLVSRWPAIFMFFAHGALYLLRTPFGAMLVPVNNQVFASVWLTVLSFEALLFTIAIAFILLAMAKERTEHRHKTDSLIDPLTGIANRRAFLQDAETRLKRQATEPRPIAVLLLDLDNFKGINDRFGHAIGDRVLQMFAEVGSGCMRRYDIFGRLGGEEFAALLVDTSRERALAVAEEIRSSFVEVTGMVEGKPVVATVSIGVVISYDAVLDLSALLAQADHALYRAKDNGRNRIEIASIELILDRVKRASAAADRAASAKAAAKSAA